MAPCLTRSLRLACTTSDPMGTEVLPVNCVLPVSVVLSASVPTGQSKGFLQLLAGATEAADAATLLGEVVFQLESCAAATEPAALSIALAVTDEGAITVEVTNVATQIIVGSISIPAAV